MRTPAVISAAQWCAVLHAIGESLAPGRLEGARALHHRGGGRGPAAQDGRHAIGHLRHVPDHDGQVLRVARGRRGGEHLRLQVDRGGGPHAAEDSDAAGAKCGGGHCAIVNNGTRLGRKWRLRTVAGPPPRGAVPGATSATPPTRSSCPPPQPSPSIPSSNPSCAWPGSAWPARPPGRPAISSRLYYDQVDTEDLGARAPEDLYGAGMAHLAFARRFATGTPKLRVYNPRADEHGWSSPHTVIEIVNDDMPFLVDSVTMELNRQGHTLHLLVHPLAKTVRDREGDLASFAPAGRDGARESLIHVEIDRESDPARLKALGRRRSSPCSPTCARRSRTGSRCARRCRRSSRSSRRPPGGLDAADVEETRAFLSLGARRALHLHRLPRVRARLRRAARTSCGSCRAPAWACCASRGWAGSRRASASCRPRSARWRASRGFSSSPRPTRARRCTGPATSTTSA